MKKMYSISPPALAFGFALALSACMVQEDPETADSIELEQSLEGIPESELITFAHPALNRVGCRNTTVYTTVSLSEFLTEIKRVEDYDANASRIALTRLSRALGCMSAADFAVTYNQIMGLVYDLDKDPVLILRLAPLVVLLTEQGSIAIDQRAHHWLDWAQKDLLIGYEKSGEWADGIEFFQLRGTTPVKMNAVRTQFMVESFSSLFWTSTTCALEGTVYRPNQVSAGQFDPVCLLDGCPQVDPRAVSDGTTYAEACAQARSEFDGSVGTAGGGASGTGGANGGAGGSLSGSLANPSGAVGAIMECMARFSAGSGARHTACVQAVANQRPVTNLSSTATLITTMRPRGCASNPVAQGGRDLTKPNLVNEARRETFNEERDMAKSQIQSYHDAIYELKLDRDEKTSDLQKKYNSYVAHDALCSGSPTCQCE